MRVVISLSQNNESVNEEYNINWKANKGFDRVSCEILTEREHLFYVRDGKKIAYLGDHISFYTLQYYQLISTHIHERTYFIPFKIRL